MRSFELGQLNCRLVDFSLHCDHVCWSLIGKSYTPSPLLSLIRSVRLGNGDGESVSMAASLLYAMQGWAFCRYIMICLSPLHLVAWRTHQSSTRYSCRSTFSAMSSSAKRGYSKLSHFMYTKNHVILKQFRSTALRDILYLQAQLVHLETEFQNAAKVDRESGDKTRLLYDVEWFTLSCPENGSYSKQWGLELQIRSVLEQFCQCALHCGYVTLLIIGQYGRFKCPALQRNYLSRRTQRIRTNQSQYMDSQSRHRRRLRICRTRSGVDSYCALRSCAQRRPHDTFCVSGGE
jgi:hypothetical protein